MAKPTDPSPSCYFTCYFSEPSVSTTNVVPDSRSSSCDIFASTSAGPHSRKHLGCFRAHQCRPYEHSTRGGRLHLPRDAPRWNIIGEYGHRQRHCTAPTSHATPPALHGATQRSAHDDVAPNSGATLASLPASSLLHSGACSATSTASHGTTNGTSEGRIA